MPKPTPPARDAADASAAPTSLVPRPGLLRALGVFGLDHLEPTILAALVTREPLLLIGPHGTGKSLLLTRLSEALGLSFRHYNASLLNFDDLLGFPLPQADGKLDYVQTPASIWGAQAVIFDEINRCRPDMANRLFPIVHERRAQGIALTDLEYRWAAMNPPRDDEADDEDPYVGTRPLDAALADRFAFVVRMPDWADYAEEDQLAIVAAEGEPVTEGASRALTDARKEVRARLQAVADEEDRLVCAYVRTLISLLRQARITLSPRRAGMLRRAILATRAADFVLASGHEFASSILQAVMHGIPQPAIGPPVKTRVLRKAHQEAWDFHHGKLSRTQKRLLFTTNPVDRVRIAIADRTLGHAEFTSVAREAMAAAGPGIREAIAFHLVETGAAERLHAAVAEEAAAMCGKALSTAEAEPLVPTSVWGQAANALARLDPKNPRAHLAANSVVALLDRGDSTDAEGAIAGWLRADRWLRESGKEGAR